MAQSPQWHRGGSSSRLTAAKYFSLAVIGGGLGGGGTHRSKVLTWMSPSPPIVKKDISWVKLVRTVDPLKEKTPLMGHTQQDSNKILVT